jgi:hypothetical protein
MKNRRKISILSLFILAIQWVMAHPMPNTVVNLSIQKTTIGLTVKMPLQDFQIAFGAGANGLKAITSDNLKIYFQQHIKAIGADSTPWRQEFIGYDIAETVDKTVGSYQELTANMLLTPSVIAHLRAFDLHYDVLIHQIANHEALVYVHEDWENGIHEQGVQAGIIRWDVSTGTIDPLSILLEKGSFWKGFKSMVELGMRHIAEGTDHLLFLLTLLLPAPLLVSNKKWAKYGGLRYSLLKLLKIITAFTVGHSITLLFGTLGWLPFSSQLIEICIAISILISAFHVLKPLFYNKEIYIAAGFGLIHGLAFSDTLKSLHLDSMQMGLSILGFNVGIEIMQLFIMALIIPELILLSRTKYYPFFRILGGILAAIAAIAWLIQRCSNTDNFITKALEVGFMELL